MNTFSGKSKENLITAHPDLQILFNEVIKDFDCTILCGHRGQAEQDEAFRIKASKVKWPYSKHNLIPSMAVDVTPYPLEWKDEKRMYYFAGFVKEKAKELGIDIRWGGDWDSDTEVDDQDFNDLPHFELIGG